MTRAWLAGVLALGTALLAACGGSQANQPSEQTPGQERSKGFSKDDRARCEWKGRTDREVAEATAAGAFTPNIRRVWQTFGEGSDRRRVLICREVDTNFDGVKDMVRTYNDKGEALREEADTDYDGTVDSWITFANGRLAKQEIDLNGDGKKDRWKYYSNGRLSRIQRDTNGDGKPDVWEIYVRGTLERIGVDLDHDGRVDRWDRDEMGRVITRTKQTGSDETTTGGPQANKKESEEGDESPNDDDGAKKDDKSATVPDRPATP